MIQFHHVSFSYDKDKPVLEDISFQIESGESVGLIGANGAGKSTLMKLLLGLETGSGQILVDHLPVTADNLSVIRRKVGFVLQNSDNQMFMPTVYEDMSFGLLNAGLSREEASHKVDETLMRLHLEELKNRHNHTLSGGEKKMAAIATVLAMEPDVIAMDEPTSSLDPWHRHIVIRTIRELPQTRIITSHDLDLIRQTCTRVILLSHGRIKYDGSPEGVTPESLFPA